MLVIKIAYQYTNKIIYDQFIDQSFYKAKSIHQFTILFILNILRAKAQLYDQKQINKQTKAEHFSILMYRITFQQFLYIYQQALKISMSNTYKIGEDQEITYVDCPSILGTGNYANVYQGYHSKNIHQKFAIKKIYREHINQQRQIQILSKLQHDNLIKFFKIIKEKNTTYIVTQLCDKKNLEQIISQQKGLASQKVFDYSYQILFGVNYLHNELKVMHRDLKTSNILLKDGKIKIADFGSAKDISIVSDIFRDFQQSIVGTPIYSSPQLTHQLPYNVKCDVWSIGCIIYEMLASQKLFPYQRINQSKEDHKNQKYIQRIKENLKPIDKDNFWTGLLINKVLTYQEQSRYTVQKLLTIIKNKKQKYIKIGPNQEIIYNSDLQLGKGSFGTVYEGIMNKEAAAVKQLHKKGKFLKKINPNFDREFEILKKLDHPHIIKYHLSYIDPKTDTVFVVTEKCQSKNLGQYIKQNERNGKFDMQTIFKHAYQLIRAMKYMHTLGFMHRDIKPANILLTSQNNIKLADFGLAKCSDNIQRIAEHTLSGSPIYSSPRIINQQEYSGKCDVWSVACLFFQMLTGKPLFGPTKRISDIKQLHKQLKQSRKKKIYLKEIKDIFWVNILQKMLTYQDKQRPNFKYLKALFKKEKRQKDQIMKNLNALQKSCPSQLQLLPNVPKPIKNHLKSYKVIRIPYEIVKDYRNYSTKKFKEMDMQELTQIIH